MTISPTVKKIDGRIMKVDYKLYSNDQLTYDVRSEFAAALEKQNKVQGHLDSKADRCKLLCLVKIDGNVVGVGAIKPKTKSDFSGEKSGLSDVIDDFEYELGYLYTDSDHTGKGIAKNIARLLVDSYACTNLMASTEISANPAMVRILEQLGFRHYGKPWKSAIHENYLGLFLKYK